MEPCREHVTDRSQYVKTHGDPMALCNDDTVATADPAAAPVAPMLAQSLTDRKSTLSPQIAGPSRTSANSPHPHISESTAATTPRNHKSTPLPEKKSADTLLGNQSKIHIEEGNESIESDEDGADQRDAEDPD